VETQDKLNALKAWASKLDKEIQDEKAKDFLLGLAKNWLSDVESGIGPASMLVLVEQLLEQAQKAVNDYGPTVRIMG
jgi:hypothetical protein